MKERYCTQKSVNVLNVYVLSIVKMQWHLVCCAAKCVYGRKLLSFSHARNCTHTNTHTLIHTRTHRTTYTCSHKTIRVNFHNILFRSFDVEFSTSVSLDAMVVLFIDFPHLRVQHRDTDQLAQMQSQISEIDQFFIICKLQLNHIHSTLSFALYSSSQMMINSDI